MESKEYVQGYIERARNAQKKFESYTQEQVDEVVRIIAKTVFDNAELLAQLSVEETGMGNYPDKVAKNQGKARVIWNGLRGKKSVGIIERNEETGITKVAKPKGVIAAITPCTNPIVTPMSNAMFAVKGRNAIIITPHHKAIRCSTKCIDLINEKLKEIGAPEYLIQIIGDHSRENTGNLISMADVVIATGGMSMVKAAYSSGKPALGVGAGNVQCIIDRNVDLQEVTAKIIAGRSFDNGIICSGEQSAIVPREKYAEVLAAFEKNGAYCVTEKGEVDAFRDAVFVKGAMNKDLVGQTAQAVGKVAGREIPKEKKVVVVEALGKGAADILAKEKMCPVIALYQYDTFEEAVEIAEANLEQEGKGHSVSIHSNNQDHIEYAGDRLCVSRFVINQVCATSAGGSFYNGFAPTNTLGCGSWGNNSISENLDYIHLINISRIGYYMKDNVVPTDAELFGDK